MLFLEDALFGFVLIDLAEEIALHPTAKPDPLPCDRWLARSAMQKSCRRGDVEIAQRALATLFVHDRSAVWRHLTTIALEDVGVANVDVIARIVAARQDRKWRAQMGGDWAVASQLVRQIATSDHCQAACDLLLRSLNSPSLDEARRSASDASGANLTSAIRNRTISLDERAVAVLASGGGLVEHQAGQPALVFDLLAAGGYCSHVVAICRAAWRASRNPMSMLLPLLWPEWMKAGTSAVKDDEIDASPLIDGVPAYAIDQFTRSGGRVARALLARDPALVALFDEAGIPRGRQPRAIGDLIFLMEGSALSRRALWQEGERLRRPFRALPATRYLIERTNEAFVYIRSQRSLIDDLRRTFIHQV